MTCNSGEHFAGNRELFPVRRHSFRDVVRSWYLAGNSFIVNCHVVEREPANEWARCSEKNASYITISFYCHKISTFYVNQTRKYDTK